MSDCGGWNRHCRSQKRMEWPPRKPKIATCEEEGSLSGPARVLAAVRQGPLAVAKPVFFPMHVACSGL